jgi:hypothetical protein
VVGDGGEDEEEARVVRGRRQVRRKKSVGWSRVAHGITASSLLQFTIYKISML